MSIFGNGKRESVVPESVRPRIGVYNHDMAELRERLDRLAGLLEGLPALAQDETLRFGYDEIGKALVSVRGAIEAGFAKAAEATKEERGGKSGGAKGATALTALAAAVDRVTKAAERIAETEERLRRFAAEQKAQAGEARAAGAAGTEQEKTAAESRTGEVGAGAGVEVVERLERLRRQLGSVEEFLATMPVEVAGEVGKRLAEGSGGGRQQGAASGSDEAEARAEERARLRDELRAAVREEVRAEQRDELRAEARATLNLLREELKTAAAQEGDGAAATLPAAAEAAQTERIEDYEAEWVGSNLQATRADEQVEAARVTVWSFGGLVRVVFDRKTMNATRGTRSALFVAERLRATGGEQPDGQKAQTLYVVATLGYGGFTTARDRREIAKAARRSGVLVIEASQIEAFVAGVFARGEARNGRAKKGRQGAESEADDEARQADRR